MTDRPVRVLLGKVGLDLHDIGAKYVARGLREAGMEVIYLGPFQTAATMLDAAVSEDPDVIAVSTVSGEYMSYVPEIAAGLKAEDLAPMLVLGGLVSPADAAELARLGVHRTFGPGSRIEEIVAAIRAHVAASRATAEPTQ